MDVPKPSKYCSVSQREFQLGEPFFSVLIEENRVWRRTDCAAGHWNPPLATLPENWYGWWQTKQPPVTEKKL
ncbi:MAG: hypothetical protein LBN39_00740, partial [Planctomycetaceae bacterium]|nr:hypothetical protein [Planctomycetaceae bacterium]